MGWDKQVGGVGVIEMGAETERRADLFILAIVMFVLEIYGSIAITSSEGSGRQTLDEDFLDGEDAATGVGSGGALEEEEDGLVMEDGGGGAISAIVKEECLEERGERRGIGGFWENFVRRTEMFTMIGIGILWAEALQNRDQISSHVQHYHDRTLGRAYDGREHLYLKASCSSCLAFMKDPFICKAGECSYGFNMKTPHHKRLHRPQPIRALLPDLQAGPRLWR